ncbi:reverse transcriptase domain-containing protein [Paraburkholderia sp. EG287A]|uniref:reverse transcriptase domain-containing protein n=1 Tax=unclassified Paraburkholderia TaxID=2615204 RepID=UPI0034D207FF
MTPLRQRMIDDMRVRNLAANTQRLYVSYVSAFARHFAGAISPLLSNVYLTEVDRMLERAKEATRNGKYTYVEYARFADDLFVLIDAHPRHDSLLGAVSRRLREEFARLQVEVNEEKSRTVDLRCKESFGFLGFGFRQLRSFRTRACWLYEELGLFNGYRGPPYRRTESAPGMIGPINLDVKQTGERSAGKPQATFDVAGAGNVTMAAGLRSTAKAVERSPEPTVRAPVLDPTCERLGVQLPGSTHPSK